MIREVLTLAELERLGSDEAAALLRVRQDAGVDDLDDAVFDAWLAADPANADAWSRICASWAAFDDIGDHAAVQELREAALEQPRHQRRWRSAIAASVAVVAATGGALLLNRPDVTGSAVGGLVADAGAVRPLTTAKGERRTFALADNSKVTLNTDSAVAVAFRPDGERRLELIRGQAYFEVAPDKARPFVVAYQGRTVTAIGTAFEVRAERAAMRVILVEGRVSVGRVDSPPVVMRPGQQLLAGPRGLTLSPADLGATDDWRRGVVTFRKTPLKAAAEEFNRYTGRQLLISDPRVGQLTVSGVFRTDDAGRFARTVEAILPVRVVPAKGGALEIVPVRDSRQGPR
jgi:transmembrane sensor